jgi:hypothetical protein
MPPMTLGEAMEIAEEGSGRVQNMYGLIAVGLYTCHSLGIAMRLHRSDEFYGSFLAFE